MIHFLHDDGTLHCRPGVHADREREPLLALLATRAAVSASSGCLIASVFASGTLTMMSGSGGLAARLLGPGDATPLLERLGTGSAAMIPLVVGSRAKAVLSLIAGKDDRFTTASALVAEDLARYIRLTLDRIQLYREAQNANRLKDGR
jgi:hypothetical protein